MFDAPEFRKPENVIANTIVSEAVPPVVVVTVDRNRGTGICSERYYWSVSESEFATDVCFQDAASLAKFYPQFLHHGIRSFSSVDILRFLGKRAVQHCQGEIKSTLKDRTEGVRIRHTVNGNSIKVYDKEESVLRVETTIVHPGHFKVYRPVRDQLHAELKWQRLRRGVADLWRRAEVSQADNSRYLQALASVTGTTPFTSKRKGSAAQFSCGASATGR